MSEQERFSIAPYFLVPDVTAAAEWYRDKLGFTFEQYWGEPPCFAMMNRSGITIMLKQFDKAGKEVMPNSKLDAPDSWDAYIWVPDVDALHAEFQAADVTLSRPLCDQPYGCREFDITDLNGYIISFGQIID